MAADVARVKKMAEAVLSAPVLAALTKAQVDDKRPKKVTAKNRAEIAATGKGALIEYVDHPIQGPACSSDSTSRRAGFLCEEEALSVLRAKALPNGDEVARIWIVVPLREHAIAMHERVVAAGFEAAVYPVGTDFWDPVPKGPWLDESTDNGVDITPR